MHNRHFSKLSGEAWRLSALSQGSRTRRLKSADKRRPQGLSVLRSVGQGRADPSLTRSEMAERAARSIPRPP
jgi:hypothetical protein